MQRFPAQGSAWGFLNKRKRLWSKQGIVVLEFDPTSLRSPDLQEPTRGKSRFLSSTRFSIRSMTSAALRVETAWY